MRVLLLPLFAILAIPGAHAASFDCRRAATTHEHHICGDPALDAADGRMGDAYRVAAAGFAVRGAVLAVQRRFLAGYDRCDSQYAESCASVLQAQTAKLRSMVNDAIYSNTASGQTYGPDDGLFWMTGGTDEAVLHFFGGFMPDMNDPQPFPQGFVCDDTAILTRTPGGYAMHQDGMDITVSEDSLDAPNLSCSPRNGLIGTYPRVR